MSPPPPPRRQDVDLSRIAALVAVRARHETEIAAAVRQARLHGHTWQEIAQALGVSHQAAHKKYGPFPKGPTHDHGPDDPPGSGSHP